MNIFKAYAQGFINTSSAVRMIVLIYLINFFVAALVAMPFRGVLTESVGQSAQISKLLADFNFTVFYDLLSQLKGAFTFLVKEAFWLGIVYFFLNIFLTGGILKSLNKSKFSMRTFFEGSGYNFFRFMGLALFMMIFYVFTFFVIFVPTSFIIDNTSLQSEKTMVYIYIVSISIFIITCFVLFMISDYAKFYMLLNDTGNFFRAFKKSSNFVFSRFFRVLILFVLLQLIPLLFLYLYLSIEGDIGVTSGLTILIMFAIQQLFVFSRIWLRVWTFAGEFEFFSAYFIKDDKINNARARIREWDEKIETARNKLEHKKQIQGVDNKADTNIVKPEIEPESKTTEQVIEVTDKPNLQKNTQSINEDDF